MDGHYGDPVLGRDIACRQCPCPGTIESGHSYAATCYLDRHTNDVVCNCDTGYAGKDTYFFRYLLSSCKKCGIR